jgi:hypothetical protein
MANSIPVNVPPVQPIQPQTPAQEVETPVTKSGNSPIVQELLAAAWNGFAETLKDEDTRLFSMLTSHTPHLEGETKIVFHISNPLQNEPLQKIQPSLLKHLRTALDNENAEIEIVLTEKNETNKAYTVEDKFAQMSRKNPALMTFKQQMALDYA